MRGAHGGLEPRGTPGGIRSPERVRGITREAILRTEAACQSLGETATAFEVKSAVTQIPDTGQGKFQESFLETLIHSVEETYPVAK
jgi:hypothetical protein